MDWKTENRKDESLRRWFALNALDVALADDDKAAVAAIEINNTQLAKLKERFAALIQGRADLADHRLWFDRNCTTLVRLRRRSLHATWDFYVALHRFLDERMAFLARTQTKAHERMDACQQQRSSSWARVSHELQPRRSAIMDIHSVAGDQVFESLVNEHTDVAAACQAYDLAKVHADAINSAEHETREARGLVEGRMAELFLLIAA